VRFLAHPVNLPNFLTFDKNNPFPGPSKDPAVEKPPISPENPHLSRFYAQKMGIRIIASRKTSPLPPVLSRVISPKAFQDANPPRQERLKSLPKALTVPICPRECHFSVIPGCSGNRVPQNLTL
jgi:hypothetical protein